MIMLLKAVLLAIFFEVSGGDDSIVNFDISGGDLLDWTHFPYIALEDLTLTQISTGSGIMNSLRITFDTHSLTLLDLFTSADKQGEFTAFANSFADYIITSRTDLDDSSFALGVLTQTHIGGAGIDTLFLRDSDGDGRRDLDLTESGNVDNLQRLDIIDVSASVSTISLSRDSVRAITDSDNELLVRGIRDDLVVFTDVGWSIDFW